MRYRKCDGSERTESRVGGDDVSITRGCIRLTNSYEQ